LEGPVVLPEGTEVRVEVMVPTPGREAEEGGLGLYERFKPIIGVIKDWPSDASANVDHYLYGVPKGQ
jgi:hypothetical protein